MKFKCLFNLTFVWCVFVFFAHIPSHRFVPIKPTYFIGGSLAHIMWDEMCDVMPTIVEDSTSQRNFGEENNFEQLMFNMLDERDKLLETLRATQIQLEDTRNKLNESEKDRESLIKQINANLPQVSLPYKENNFTFSLSIISQQSVFMSTGIHKFNKRTKSSKGTN